MKKLTIRLDGKIKIYKLAIEKALDRWIYLMIQKIIVK